ncbi:MAG: hypothetical protein ACREQ5_01400 [Candidatus Dormibacteria bacterium]
MVFERINRTNIQALYRYMPGQPYNWMAKASVIGRPPRQTTSLDLPERWVAPQLSRLIRPFTSIRSGGAGTAPELEIIERDRFTLVKAEDLQAVRFPNTFLCGHNNCPEFRTVRAGERPPSCSKQHGEMRQFPWVEVHECGHLKEISPPRCENGCRSGMDLFSTRSFSTSEWYWRCSSCKTKSSRPVTNFCSTCRQARVQLDRIPRSSLYHPQQITVLNPPTRAAYATLASQQIHRAAIAQCLGVLPDGIEGLRVAGGGAAGAGAVQSVHELAATMGLRPGDQLYDQMLAKARESEDDGPAWTEAVDGLGLDEEVLDALGEECLQLTLARSAKTLDVEELRDSPLLPTYGEYRELFHRYGLEDIKLIRELPIAYLVAGYTRLSARACTRTSYRDIEPRFRFFDAARDSKFPMYGVRTETEGLLFQLDRLEVIRWLVDSQVIANPGVTNQDDAQQWLFKTLQPVTDVFSAPSDSVTKAVLGLVHSMAHRAMKALAVRCGLNVDSLAEYLFPSNCAFLIYANTRSEFTLGGLEHVFRFDLHDALTELDAENRCVFDPPCRRSFGGACAACLYVSEVACARFNTVLNRNLLFGALPEPPRPDTEDAGLSNVSGSVPWRPYWNH